MDFISLFLIAIGLSMDAFSVAICRGLEMRKVNMKNTIIIALFFGGFQGLMPIIGWFASVNFSEYITNYDHWIAFILLAIIGGNMIRESLGKEEQTESADDPPLNYKELFLMAIATSIDALAVGVSFAFLNVEIFSSAALITATTFCFSVGGVFVGNYFGIKYKSKAEFCGGVILCLLGIKILFEHLGIL